MIIILALLGIFIHPFTPGTLDFIYRFIIFAAITYITYTSLHSTSVGKIESTEVEYSIPEKENLMELEYTDKWNIENLLHSDERTNEYLRDQFDILTSILFPDNGWLFFKKGKGTIKTISNKLLIEQFSTIDKKEFEIAGLMQILDENDEILIENNLDKTGNLLNFYNNQNYKPLSFLGIPIILTDQEKIFIVFDSQNKEHFNREDKDLIAKIRNNIQLFILNRVKAYTLLSTLKEKENLLDFAQELNSCKTVSVTIQKLADRVSEVFEATRLTISFMSQQSGMGIIKKVIGQKDDFDENVEFPLEEGLTGWIISKNKPYLIEDLEKGDYFIPRYAKTEKSNFNLRSFLGIPIEHSGTVFGAVTLEHHLSNRYSEQDKEKLKEYIKVFSTTFLRQK